MAQFQNSIDTKEAIILFEAGALNSCTVAPKPLGEDSEWILLLECKKRSEPYTLAAQREQIRVFKSADGAIKTAKKIGFRTVKFQF